MDRNLRREIILDNYQNPFHKGLVEDRKGAYIRNNTNSTSCIDNVDIMYKIKDGVIEDVYFDGEACAISTSATSIMIRMLLGKSIDEARRYLENYEAMIEERPYDKDLLGELNAYEEIYLQPNRKKCALLPFESLKRVLEEEYEKRKD